MATWTITLEAGTTISRDFPDVECPYPWGDGLAILDPSAGMPSAVYQAGNVREVRLATLPTTGTYRYRLTRVDNSTLDVFTSDPDGLSTYGTGYYTISRTAATGRGRYVLLIARWNRISSIERTAL